MIGNSAFYGCTSLNQLGLPVGLTEIWDNDFWECLTVFGDYVFDSCTSLNQLTLPAGL
eukprot:CAMPEP_0197312314 /NCGR_PEP_ID=MMETSP0891-20130614/19181_1 /TAXON_ID=44058 ORGANISM="Aureoumbra lagunensis, Strain CCMP1510" /NCGR_SAMPLE_ID=MMETSP0891 /ASSEMBLY_ACC=CAM_ASM_000534 /LENGTH=57 /DNA_ID=CAMNT_0042799321 /DNA_START=110 /DNA_END=280 /DNA_ORIENTATION=+